MPVAPTDPHESRDPHGTVVSLVRAARPGSKRLTAEVLWGVPRVGDPVPSPDGRAAAVTVVTFDVAADKGRGRIWIVPADGSPPRALTAEEHDSREPAWSPDGTRIAFVRKGREKDAKAQLYVTPVGGGEPERVTDAPLGVYDPTWLPDGSGIVVVVKLLRGHLSVEATRTEIARREKDPVKAVVTEDRVFRFWDRWLPDGEMPHLFVADPAAKTLRDVMPSAATWFSWTVPSGQYDVSPDGRDIAYAANFIEARRDLLRTGVFVVPVAGGEPRCLTPDHPDGDFHPRWTPDGTALVWGTQEDPFFYADRVRLERWDRATGRIERILDDWDLSPGGVEFAPDGTLWFDVERDGRQGLHRFRPGSPPEEVVRGGAVGGVAPAADGAVWFTMGTLSDAPEVHRLAPGARDPVRVTHFTDDALRDVAMGAVHEVRFTGGGGERVQMFVVFPPGHDAPTASAPTEDTPTPGAAARLPLVHVIHGGPHGLSADAFHPRWNAQVFAAPGHLVAMVNFQGSTSWGQDFAQRIQGAWGDRPFDDVMRATDALVALGWADPDRMAATGGSYGGYLVSWIAGHTDRFRCLVNHAGVFDSWGQYATDVTQGRHRSFGGEPWDRIEVLDRWSPARSAKDMRTPMLVLHGERDYRVPGAQTLTCYSILKAKGVPARLVWFPDENHWILKPQNSLLWYREVLGWIARWFGPAEGAR